MKGNRAPNYGIDAPLVVRNLLIVAALGVISLLRLLLGRLRDRQQGGAGLEKVFGLCSYRDPHEQALTSTVSAPNRGNPVRKRSITIAAAAAACVLFAAASPSPQDPARQRVANAYGDWLVGYVGKAFDLSTDRAIQDDKSPFKLVAVGQDYAAFESDSGRVCIPFAMLRVHAAK
jgi:hypothetical protein